MPPYGTHYRPSGCGWIGFDPIWSNHESQCYSVPGGDIGVVKYERRWVEYTPPTALITALLDFWIGLDQYAVTMRTNFNHYQEEILGW